MEVGALSIETVEEILQRHGLRYQVTEGHILLPTDGILIVIGVDDDFGVIFLQVPMRPGKGMQGYLPARPENENNTAIYMLAANYRLALGGFTRDVDGEIRYECSLFVKGSTVSDEQVIGALVIAVAAVQRHTPILEGLLSGRMPLTQALAQLDRHRTLQTA